ncbi:MAG TPA: nicotinate-nucleotide--dimethylbenzimidazole phosphoribosyltransferase [Candidatus Merdivicinus faecavium]|nr:nicotinate-nucleotide--dimethylbenzimidazole phosphoribosyltransferase [Candidatus Merdivicinus faecavium]
MTLTKQLSAILPPDEEAMRASKTRWDSIAKPLGSLGKLETEITRIAGLTGSAEVDLSRRAVLIFCADNGVVAQGVTQSGSEVTATVSENFTRGAASVCAMARAAHTEVYPVDIGIAREMDAPGLIDRKIRFGTADMTEGPAMTREEAIRAIQTGIDLVGELKAQGVRIIATGEMGIGNTTTSSAVVSVLLDKPVETVTGRGAGLDSAGLRRKIAAIRRAVESNRPDPSDPIDVLSKVGGLDIAGIAGAFLGGAIHRVPVVVDGFISGTAALVALRLCPAAKCAVFASHVSAEPAGRMVLDAIGLSPMITADMCLGEGTGAVSLFPLLDMGLAVYREMRTFDAANIETYTYFED